MKSRSPNRAPGVVINIISVTVVFSSLWYLGCFAWLAAHRMGTPFLIEANEGLILDHVLWLLQGNELYREPNLTFTPILYPPLHYELSILATKIMGTALPAVRSVSIVSSFVMFALVAALVHQQTRSHLASLASAGILAATYPLCDWWFDVGRVDSLQVALALATVYCLLHYESRTSRVTAAVLFGLALFAKQTSFLLLGPFLLGTLYRFPKHRTTFLLSSIGVALIGLLALGLRYGELRWAYFYLIELPRSHPWNWEQLVSIVTLADERVLLLALAMSAALVATQWKCRKGNHLDLLLLFLLGATINSFVGQMKIGGVANHRVAFHAAVAIFFGCALSQLARVKFNRQPRSDWRAMVVVIFAQVQLAILFYPPSAAYAMAKTLRPSPELLTSFTPSDEILVVHHYGYLRRLGGGPGNLATGSWGDLIYLAPQRKESAEFAQSVRQDIESGRYRRVVSSHVLAIPHGWFRKHYQRTDVGPGPEAGWLGSVPGARIYTRRPSLPNSNTP